MQGMFLFDELFENLSIFTTTNDNALECRKLPKISMMGADLPQLETNFNLQLPDGAGVRIQNKIIIYKFTGKYIIKNVQALV